MKDYRIKTCLICDRKPSQNRFQEMTKYFGEFQSRVYIYKQGLVTEIQGFFNDNLNYFQGPPSYQLIRENILTKNKQHAASPIYDYLFFEPQI